MGGTKRRRMDGGKGAVDGGYFRGIDRTKKMEGS